MVHSVLKLGEASKPLFNLLNRKLSSHPVILVIISKETLKWVVFQILLFLIPSPAHSACFSGLNIKVVVSGCESLILPLLISVPPSGLGN